MSFGNIKYHADLDEDWDPRNAPPRQSRVKNFVRVKVSLRIEREREREIETNPERPYAYLYVQRLDDDLVELRERSRDLVSLRQFTADSQGIIAHMVSEIDLNIHPDSIDAMSQAMRNICRGAIAVDPYRRIVPLHLRFNATATTQYVESLATVEESESECPICLAALGHRIIRLPCSHAFHSLCIAKWLNANPTCPIYRYRMPRS